MKGQGVTREVLFVVPKDVKALVVGIKREQRGRQIREIEFLKSRLGGGILDNPSLVIDKYVPFAMPEKKRIHKPDITRLKNNIKASPTTVKVYEQYFRNFSEMLSSLGALRFRLTTKSRLVVGLGDESVYETSIRLLRNYGLPYIPGTALKGVARTYALEKFADVNLDKLKDEFKTDDFYEIVGELDRALSEGKDLSIETTFGENSGVNVSFKDLIEIFGTTEKKGSVVFFDALPTPTLEQNLGDIFDLDIMNPHYGPYYQKGEPPGDWHDPVPVIFLTVKKGVEFLFAVAPLENEELAKNAGAILREALREHGVGAKTSLGYGRFQ